MIEGIVYRYVSPEGKSYVGQTTNEERRRKDFGIVARHPKGGTLSYRSKSFRYDLERFGVENFTYEVLYKNSYETMEDAQADLWQKEEFFIDYFDSFNNGYNKTLGGNGTKGHKVPKEQVEKQRQWLIEFYKTHPNPFQGKKHSEETRKILSEQAKKRTGKNAQRYGKTITSEQIRALSKYAIEHKSGKNNPFYGKTHSEESKRKAAETRKNKKPVLQIDIHTGEIINTFPSALEAARAFGYPQRSYEITRCCQGHVSPRGWKSNTWRGYKWKYQE
jgi:group I intron endonuclease